MFKLLRYFSITSLVSILIATIVLGFVYRQLAVNELMEVEKMHHTALTQAFANSLWTKFSPLLATEGLSGDELLAHPSAAGLRRAVNRQIRDLPVVKVRVYNLAGQTVFSTEAGQTGEDRSTTPMFLAARAGKVVSELSHRDSFHAVYETTENRDLLASCVPARRVADSPIEGVFEIYSDVTPFIANVKRTQLTAMLSIALVLGLLYGVLFLIVRHADKILKRQEMERREADEALRESELKFRSLTQSANDAIISADGDGAIISWNRGAQAIFGFTEEEIIGKPLTLLIPERYRAAHKAGLERMRAGAAPRMIGKTVTLSGLRRDGSEFPLELSLSSWTTKQGLFYGSILRDITERAQAQAEIARLASFPQENPNPVMEVNSSGVVTYLNPGARAHFPGMEMGGASHPVLEGLVDMFRHANESIVTREISFADQTYAQHINIKNDVMRIRMTNVTERRRIEQVLAESEARLRTLMNLAPIGIFTMDAKGGCNYVNDRWCQLTGYSEAQARGQGWVQALHPEDKEEVFTVWNEAVKNGSEFAHAYRFLSPTGRVTWVSGSAVALMDGTGAISGYIGTAMDVTERMRAEERLDYLAHHDSLTGLPNRVLLHDRLQQTMIDARRHDRLAAVLFLDLDRFKTINDTLGHETGDALLKAVAERLQGCVRDGDTVARLGGDEFSVVLADVAHVDDVARVAHKILHSVATPFQIAGKELFVTTSIGVTLFPFDDNTPEGLLKNADVAMYQAKEAGRNAYRYFTAEMNVRALERLRLETDLRHAIERNELLLMYQPQVNLKDGRLIGVEALIRWRHPESGLVSPAQFIPIAEETGLIGPIGEWVLRTACAQNKAWQNAGLPPVYVTVNVSARQLKQQGLIHSVTRILKDTGLAPEYLGLELTESMLVENVERTVAVLNELHALGVCFSIDDFGTGYSSLNYLKRFPIDILKIDQSFMRGIPGNAEDTAIARAIIVMAHGLGIKTIAEGVETEAQFAFLRTHRCDGMQGFYFSPAVPAETIAQLLQTGRQMRNE